MKIALGIVAATLLAGLAIGHIVVPFIQHVASLLVVPF